MAHPGSTHIHRGSTVGGWSRRHAGNVSLQVRGTVVHRLSYGGPAEAEILKVHVVYPCLSMFILSIWGVLSHGRTPSHPFVFGIFHENHENHPAIGDLPWIGNLLRSNFHFLEKPVTVSAVGQSVHFLGTALGGWKESQRMALKNPP